MPGVFQYGEYLLIFTESMLQGWGPVSAVKRAEHPDKWKKTQPQTGKRRERQAGISCPILSTECNYLGKMLLSRCNDGDPQACQG